ncbi:ATP-binding protein [Nonomuraea sp. CA-143628]|uniref:ATP-binding protein n=1 Tax=Nonomuraea sp. CA-143628 TaxID=3239997 RepID=UPI003D903761
MTAPLTLPSARSSAMTGRRMISRPPPGDPDPDKEGNMHTTTSASAKEWRASAPPRVLRYTFPGVPEQVRKARKLVEKLFTGTGREDDAGLVIDELANNSVLYTRSGQPGGWFGVELAFGTLVRVGVADLGGAGWLIGAPSPCSHQPTPDDDLIDLGGPAGLEGLAGVALGGRGLAIVAELAVTTGAYGSEALGHFVWADLALPEPAKEPSGEVMRLLVS